MKLDLGRFAYEEDANGLQVIKLGEIRYIVEGVLRGSEKSVIGLRLRGRSTLSFDYFPEARVKKYFGTTPSYVGQVAGSAGVSAGPEFFGRKDIDRAGFNISVEADGKGTALTMDSIGYGVSAGTYYVLDNGAAVYLRASANRNHSRAWYENDNGEKVQSKAVVDDIYAFTIGIEK